jgi:hypothetical protein
LDFALRARASIRISDVADTNALSQGGELVRALGNELLGDKSLIAGLHDGAHDGGIIKLLGFIDLVASGDAAGVIV